MEICPYEFNFPFGISANRNFCVFKSIENIYYLVYSKKFDIFSYNLNDMKIQNKIAINNFENKGCYYYVHILGHLFDKVNKRDLILINTISNMLIYNFNTLEFLFSYEANGSLGCLLYDKNKLYMYAQIYDNDHYKDIFIDLKEKKVKKFPSIIIAYFSDSYYEDDKDEWYIILGTVKNIISFKYFSENIKIYHEFSDGIEVSHVYVKIKKEKEITKLFDGSNDGYIRIWNFHTGELLNKILICKNFRVLSFDFLDDKYIICGTSKDIIELFDIEAKKFIKKVGGCFKEPRYIKTINIPKVAQYLFVYCETYNEINVFKISKKDY